METAIRAFAALNLLVIGVSHVLQHRAWVEFLLWLHGHGRAGAFANGLLALFPGTLIVAFHSVWSGYAVVLTVLGWLWVIKGAAVMLFPDLGVRSLARLRTLDSRLLAIPGVVFAGIGAVLIWSLWPEWP